MHAIELLVPGFDRALARMPGATPAWGVLAQSTRDGALSDRASALVQVAVAQRAGGEYARWAIARLAEKQGLNAEDLFLATVGTARHPREAAIVKAAGTMASHGRFTDTAAYRELTAMLGADSATRVLSHVTLALLACDVLDSVAPGPQAAASPREGA